MFYLAPYELWIIDYLRYNDTNMYNRAVMQLANNANNEYIIDFSYLLNSIALRDGIRNIRK